MIKEKQPRKPVKRKPERSEKAKERGRKRHFKFCREYAPNTNPHRYRDVYPRWWVSTLIRDRN